MFEKFAEAFSLLFKNIWLFSAIVLTVWLPGNVLVLYVASIVGEEDFVSVLQATLLIEAIFGPLYIGAMVHALARIKSGNAVTYGSAMSVAVRKWFVLFATRFISGIIIAVGLVLLIVPGIYFALRYALIDPAVVVENRRIFDSLERSSRLTAGRRWKILGAMLLLFLGLIVITVLIYLPIGFAEGILEMMEMSVNLAPVELVVDCAMSVLALVIQIVLFLYYWEAVKGEPAAGATSGGDQRVSA
jgi:hypothetical protein